MDPSVDGENLEKLLQVSKTAEGRSRLATAGTLAVLLRRLSTILPVDLLPVLRILRNLCAGEAANQDAFLHLGGPVVVETVLFSPLQIWRLVESDCSYWGTLHWPERCTVLRSGDLSIREDTCCSSEGGRRRFEELCDDERGLPIVVEIIKTACAGGYEEEWLEWLVTKICIEEPYLLLLFQKLASSMYDYGKTEAVLLKLLSKSLSNRPVEISLSNDFALSILKIFREASNVRNITRVSSALPTGSPTIDVLGYSLMILRDACAWEDPSLAVAESPVDSLVSHGLMDLILSILEELGPPSSVRRVIENSSCKAAITESKRVCSYRGFRRDLVSVIGNCLYRRKHIQDEIRKRNAIPLLLQQCVVEEDNPFLREWGLFAVRNLLEGNEENQLYVTELQLQESFNTPEVLELGLKVELDRQSGRPKLVNIS
ncbi:hypothetical protein HPP92_001393 [Vanilla planifolia]|uniref:Ataxin-10 domain-containing protein n=1 Tax=Vanilla planifolia TaxID=51239 RepID=A0A835RZT6_VANPL|nr:hypothetical protein HPP92_001393 [Vanilla planifolia]